MLKIFTLNILQFDQSLNEFNSYCIKSSTSVTYKIVWEIENTPVSELLIMFGLGLFLGQEVDRPIRLPHHPGDEDLAHPDEETTALRGEGGRGALKLHPLPTKGGILHQDINTSIGTSDPLLRLFFFF